MNYQKTFKENKYTHVHRLVDEDKCQSLFKIFEEQKNKGNYHTDNQCVKSLSMSGVFDFLLEELQPQMEKITGKKLYPTYSYARWYLPEDELILHKDRPSCEYSCTLTVGYKGNPWSIFMGESEDKSKGKEVNMMPGDAVVYKGCDLFHWREKYIEGEWQAQIFLHYVDVEGPFKEWKYDKREGLTHHYNEKGEIKLKQEKTTMINPQELKDKDFKIYLGMPMYGGMLCEATLHGLLEIQQWSMAKGVGLRFQSMGNESLITRARNTIVSMMMDDKDFVATHLLFIDADIGFSWRNIERLLCADKDIACGIYPRKHLHLEKISKWVTENPNISSDELEAKILGYNVNFDDPNNIRGENGFYRVNEAATGMMLVKRDVFRTMFKKFPERKYESDQIVNGQYFKSDNCYDLFAVGPYKTQHVDGSPMIRYLSEDYYFSRLWQECGGEIWADLMMPLTHFGNRAFKGHVGAMIGKK